MIFRSALFAVAFGIALAGAANAQSASRELIKRGEFPKPISLSDSGRAKGWLESEILVWQAKRLATRDATDRRPTR